MKAEHPNCHRCRHFFVTYRSGRGYACRALGFESRDIPWRVVQGASSMPCLYFAPRLRPARPSNRPGHRSWRA